MDTPTISLIVSLISLYVALRVAWDTRFKPAKPVAVFQSFVIWEFNKAKAGEHAEAIVIPRIVLANLGAKTLFIEGIRIGLTGPNQPTLWLHVDFTVPEEAIEHFGEFIGKDSAVDDYTRLVGGAFSGVLLSSGDVCRLHSNFVAARKLLEKVSGRVDALVQIKLFGRRGWRTLARERFDFSESPFLSPETKASYGLRFIYSESWQERRKDKLR